MQLLIVQIQPLLGGPAVLCSELVADSKLLKNAYIPVFGVRCMSADNTDSTR